jgi:tRNA 2-thiouridine synthesizing protein A
VLKARKRLKALEKGQVLRLQATDPAAVIDVAHFCAQQGHSLLKQLPQGDAVHYFIQKG